MWMSGRFLLDTNITIGFFTGETSIQERLAQAEEVFVSCIALGELYFGACKSSRVEENLARIDEFAVSSVVLGCDIDTAREYGLIKDLLRTKGQPIPENDIRVAAVARQHDLTLVTRDDHFTQVEDMKREIW